jgi:hypothetical protein
MGVSQRNALFSLVRKIPPLGIIDLKLSIGIGVGPRIGIQKAYSMPKHKH